MKKSKYSLYFALAIIIFLAVVVTTSINSLIGYQNFKTKAIDNIKISSTETILSLKDNIQNLIEAYAVNEYEKLIFNEISRRNIYAIVIEDYNMGQIIGKASFITGKIKKENKIINYVSDNKEHKSDLAESFYKESSLLFSKDKKRLGKITIYISDKKMTKELNEIIFTNLKSTVLLSLFLILFLFISIRLFILRPISDIIETISKRDPDGIPIKPIPNHPLNEIDNLVHNINKMISSIKGSRKILKKEQNRLKYLLELSPIAVRIAKNQGESVIFANKAYSDLLDLSEDKTINENPKKYYKNKLDYEEVINSLDKKQPIYNKPIELIINNTSTWVLASYMNINFDGENSIIGWFYDITNEKNNENKLYEALELQTRIFNNSGYIIIRTDENGLIKQVNNETEKILGYKPEELIDIHTPAKFHLSKEIKQRKIELEKEFNTKIKSAFDIFVIKSKYNMKNETEWTYVTKTGQHISVILTVSALKNKNDEIFGYVGTVKDITQNKIIESQIKLASMGEMIGNIAHQWRQPLSAISSIASSIKLKNELDIIDSHDINNNMDSIMHQSNYLSNTIDDFRNFTKNNEEKKAFLFSDMLDKTLSIIKPSFIHNNIDLIIDCKKDTTITGYENRLIQAFINIINNARDAIEDNIQNKKNKYIFISTHEYKDCFIVNIKDNAGGIRINILDKIFEPYFTTKHQSVGTGIGLSMTYQIIKDQHNAKIKASNVTYAYEGNNYTGACFEITFKPEAFNL